MTVSYCAVSYNGLIIVNSNSIHFFLVIIYDPRSQATSAIKTLGVLKMRYHLLMTLVLKLPQPLKP